MGLALLAAVPSPPASLCVGAAGSRVACAIASATPSAPLTPPGRRRTIPGTCEGTETPGWPPATLIVSGEWLHVIRSWPRRLWRRSCRGHCGRPGRDRARPAGPRAVSWFRSRPGDDRASDGCARRRSRRLDERKESHHELSSCVHGLRSCGPRFAWSAHLWGLDLPCGAGIALPGGARLGIADRAAAWPCGIG
jgi:hypothetical protein